ncbi:protein of unknown function [Cupriavidus taiwanensis]|nr:protein of unknown function [Cupriavidus taiwanensis]
MLACASWVFLFIPHVSHDPNRGRLTQNLAYQKIGSSLLPHAASLTINAVTSPRQEYSHVLCYELTMPPD